MFYFCQQVLEHKSDRLCGLWCAGITSVTCAICVLKCSVSSTVSKYSPTDNMHAFNSIVCAAVSTFKRALFCYDTHSLQRPITAPSDCASTAQPALPPLHIRLQARLQCCECFDMTSSQPLTSYHHRIARRVWAYLNHQLYTSR